MEIVIFPELIKAKPSYLNMNLKVRLFSAFIILLFPTLIGSQYSCPKPVYAGNANLGTVTIPKQSAHGKGQSTVVYDSSFTIPCTCGVIATWHLVRYDNYTDGCFYNTCDIDLIVFRNIITTSTLSATVVGSYRTNINTIAITSSVGNPYIVIPMPQAQYIPVKYGDALGWNGNISSVVYYEEACGGSCPSGLPSTNMYLFGSPMNSVTTGSTMTFTNGPAYSYIYYRHFGLRAVVYEGTRPSFVALPKTVSVTDATPVGTVVYTVGATDPETKQTLTFRISSACPQSSYFLIDPYTGDVSVNQSLVGAQSVQVLTIEVSDQCLTNTADLTINIIDVTATTATVQESLSNENADFFKSGVGYALIASSSLSCIVAIATSIGLCVFCSQLSSLTSKLDQMKGMRLNGYSKPGDGRFLYNGTKEYSLDKTHFPPHYDRDLSPSRSASSKLPFPQDDRRY